MSVRTEAFTGFGDDPNWSVKFGVQGQPGAERDWSSGPRVAEHVPATGNRTIRQRRGRDPWTIELELLFDDSDALEAMDALVGQKATLRLPWGHTKRVGGTLEVIGSEQYLTLPDTYLASLDRHTGYISYPGGMRRAIAVFKRDYIDPPAFVPPTWPAPPYPGVRNLPDPLLFLTQPLSRNASGPISAASGAARPATLGGFGAWRIIPGAKNAVPNPRFVGTTNWTADGGTASLTANGDGTARMQASALFDGISQAAGTGLAATAGDTVTVAVRMRSRTTSKSVTLQMYANNSNSYASNTADHNSGAVTVTTTWQTFSRTRTLTDPTTAYIFLRLSLSGAWAVDVDVSEPIVTKAGSVPEFVPAVDGMGVLLAGDQWDGTANASPSTRTAGSVGGALASFGSLYLRYSTDGTTVSNTVLTAPGTFGSGAGTVSYSGGTLAITSGSQVWLAAAIAYPGTLTAGQKTYLDSQPTSALTWAM